MCQEGASENWNFLPTTGGGGSVIFFADVLKKEKNV